VLLFWFLCLFLESLILQKAAKRLPKQECVKAEMAPGSAAMGDVPTLCAKTTAKAEFCMPVSMETVRAVDSLSSLVPPPPASSNFGTR